MKIPAPVLQTFIKHATIFKRASPTTNHRPMVRVNMRQMSSISSSQDKPKTFEIMGETYLTDEWTNLTPRVLTKLGYNLHNRKYHPLNLIRQRIVNFFYSNFSNRYGNPLFAVFDNINPVVSPYQNFDSLLTAKDHPSRSKSDTYYINSQCLLRSHTSAHQEELIKMGFDAFLVVGDVYRRDEIDSSHYPVFHQMEGVRLLGENEVPCYIVSSSIRGSIELNCINL